MSGIYIHGMEMPTSCYGCLFFKQVDYWNKNDEADILSKCKRTGEFTWESVNGYLPNCPLVHVPEHGRLIDAFDTVKELCDSGYYNAAEIVSDMPTIIPADGKDTNVPAREEGEG